MRRRGGQHQAGLEGKEENLDLKCSDPLFCPDHQFPITVLTPSSALALQGLQHSMGLLLPGYNLGVGEMVTLCRRPLRCLHSMGFGAPHPMAAKQLCFYLF